MFSDNLQLRNFFIEVEENAAASIFSVDVISTTKMGERTSPKNFNATLCRNPKD
jgi:hypothetical protein